jgi:DnaJ-class molecular chaperone
MKTTNDRELVRCERCLGRGYKGRTERGQWKIRTCPGCGGRGEREPPRRRRRRTFDSTH